MNQQEQRVMGLGLIAAGIACLVAGYYFGREVGATEANDSHIRGLRAVERIRAKHEREKAAGLPLRRQ